jgi:hypothetical protein
VFLGLAELAKMTWLTLFALWPSLWLFWLWRDRAACRQSQAAPGGTPSSVVGSWEGPADGIGSGHFDSARGDRVGWCHQFAQLGFILLSAVYVLNVAYGFDGTFTKLKDFTFVSRTLTGLPEPGSAGNRFADSWSGSVAVPFPRDYLLGFDAQKADFERLHLNYLHGQWKKGGWWYYYLYGLGVKVPHGIQILFALTLLSRLLRWLRVPSWRNELTLLSPAVLVFVLVSSQTALNHHFRYVLPCFPFVLVWLGRVARFLPCADQMREAVSGPMPRTVPDSGRGRVMSPVGALKQSVFRAALALLVGGALAYTVASSLFVYPHSLAYFNEAAGGPANGHKHLLHSSLDWGQDLTYLKEWYEENLYRPRPLIFLAEQNWAYLGIKHRTRTEALVEFTSQRRLLSATYVINATALFGVHGDGPMKDICDLLRMQPNPHRVGGSLCIFPIDRPVEMKK